MPAPSAASLRLTSNPAPLLDRVTATHGRAGVWLVAIALVLFLPGFWTLPPIDRDEPRFAQASKQMIETGDLVSIRFRDEARNKKPVGIYWLQAAAVTAAEHLGVQDAARTIWLYRLPSLAGAVAAVLLTYWTALAFTTRRGAFAAAALLAATLLIGVEARLAKTDAVLTACVVAAMGAMARAWMMRGADRGPPGWRLPAVFWTAMAVGVLVKGPIAPMVAVLGGGAAVLTERWRSGAFVVGWITRLRPVAGLAWCALLVAPWFWLILVKTHGAFLSEAVGRDMLGKVAGAQELHGAPPGSFLLAFFVTGWPLAPLALVAAPAAWLHRRDAAVVFLLAWLVPAWLVFELVPTKLPHYVLPLYPALAILVGYAFENAWTAAVRGWLAAVASVLLALVPASVITAAFILARRSGSFPESWFWIAAVAVLAVTLLIAVRARVNLAGGPADSMLGRTVMPFVGLAALLSWLAYGLLFAGPFLIPYSASPRLVAALEAARRAGGTCARLAPATVSYREPSLVFLAGTDLAMTGPEGAAAFLAEAPCRAAFIEARDLGAFRNALPPGTPVTLAATVTGVNLNSGKPLEIGVYVRQGSGT